MTPEEYKELKETLDRLKEIHKDITIITEKQLLSYLEIYIRVRQKVSEEDLLHFIRMIKELNNI